MAEIVTVSLVQGRRFRLNREDEYVTYKPGHTQMPIEHAKAMGLLHRIVKTTSTGETVTVKSLPFSGTFDEKLSARLEAAGYKTLDDLRKASEDDLRSIDGIGPMAIERINEVLGGK